VGVNIKGQIRTNLVELWTFAGTRMNRLLAAQMDPSAEQSSFTHRSVILKGSYRADDVATLWAKACDAVESGARIIATDQQADVIKFSEAVPVALRKQSIEYRLDPQPRTISRDLRLVTASTG
jgi:hypothetical protein